MVREIVYEPPSKEEMNRLQNEWNQNTISAGSWEKNPWWQRINPLTPSGSTRFVPSESGKKIINEFKNRYGKNIHVVPNKPNAVGNLFGGEEPGGYFDAGGTGFLSDMYRQGYSFQRRLGSALGGGSHDPLKRTVHLNQKNPTAFTLAHELGHAFDPNLTSNRNESIKQQNSAYSSPYLSPANFLKRFISPSKATFKAEVLAQKEAKESFENQGIEDIESKRDLGQYPYSYIPHGINQAEEQLTQPNVPHDLRPIVMEDRFRATSQLGHRVPFKTKYDLGMTYPNTFFDYSNQNLMNQLNLNLDSNYQKEKTNIENEAKNYLREQLGDSANPVKRTPREELSYMLENLRSLK